jgi:hypothetical protein
VIDWFKKRGLRAKDCRPEIAKQHGVLREILEWAETDQELNELEAKYVDNVLGRDPLCLNMRNGGKNGLLSDETKEKISRLTKLSMSRSSVRQRYEQAIQRCHRTETAHKNHSDAAKKTQNLLKVKEHIRQINLNQWADPKIHESRRSSIASKTGHRIMCVETLKEYDSIHNAEKILGICHIGRAIKNNSTAGGFHWTRV